MIGFGKLRSRDNGEAAPQPVRHRGFFASLGNFSLIGIVVLVVWQIAAPEGLRPSQLAGQAMYDVVHEPSVRAELRLAEIQRCDALIESIARRQDAHSERIGSTTQTATLGLVGMSIVYDVMGDRAAAMFPRKQAIDELNEAERMSLLREYVTWMRDGRVTPQGVC